MPLLFKLKVIVKCTSKHCQMASQDKDLWWPSAIRFWNGPFKIQTFLTNLSLTYLKIISTEIMEHKLVLIVLLQKKSV